MMMECPDVFAFMGNASMTSRNFDALLQATCHHAIVATPPGGSFAKVIRNGQDYIYFSNASHQEHVTSTNDDFHAYILV